MPEGSDPDIDLPPHIRKILLAGKGSVAELQAALTSQINGDDGRLRVGTGNVLPEYAFASHTVYGGLPRLKAGTFRRVMLTPAGQNF